MKFNIKNYPDNTKYVQVENFSDSLTFRINSYEDLWILKQLKDVCDYNNQEVNLTIPCLLDAQADKRFNSNESSGLKLVCQFINDMNFKSVSIFHPHNQEVVEAYIPNVKILDNKEFVTEVLDFIANPETFSINDWRILSNRLILFSSDAGGFKPLMKLADKLKWQVEVYGASKSRSYKDGKSELIQVIDRQDFEGKDVLIIDDISVYGGTFIGLSKMLKERNCGKLYLAVSHLTVINPNPALFENFDKVFTTNSKGLHSSEKFNNLQVVNLF
jgi:ribose-phosphate pyrophosphokinase